MESHAGAEEQLRLVERSQHYPEFRTADRRLGMSGIVGIEDRIDLRVIVVAVPTERRSQPVGPIKRVLRIDADAALAHPVAADVGADVGQQALLKRIGQAEIDIVVAGLNAERGLRAHAGDHAGEGARGIAADHDAAVVLVELVALIEIAVGLAPGRIGQAPSEIVVQIKRALDCVDIRFPESVVLGLHHARRQREAFGIAAIGRIERAEAADQPRVDRAQRHLVGRVPLVGIGHARDAEAIVGGAQRVAREAIDLAGVVGVVPRPVIVGNLAGEEQVAVTGFR